jgi:hypothetical protein
MHAGTALQCAWDTTEQQQPGGVCSSNEVPRRLPPTHHKRVRDSQQRGGNLQHGAG